jgi:hypothetical protein
VCITAVTLKRDLHSQGYVKEHSKVKPTATIKHEKRGISREKNRLINKRKSTLWRRAFKLIVAKLVNSLLDPSSGSQTNVYAI